MRKSITGHLKINTPAAKFFTPELHSVLIDLKVEEEQFTPLPCEGAGVKLMAFLSEEMSLPSNHTCVVDTGVDLEIPYGYRLNIDSCEELLKDGIVSKGFPLKKGRIFVYLTNISTRTKIIRKYDIVARMYLESVCLFEWGL